MKQHRKDANLKRVMLNLPPDVVEYLDESVKKTKESKSVFVARMLRMTKKITEDLAEM